MLNTTNYQENAHQNHSDMSPHTRHYGHHQKEQQMFFSNKCWKDVEKREALYTAGGNVNWCSHCGKHFGGSSKN